MIEIDEFDSYEDVHLLWRELNQNYKGGELALDWQLHDELWRRFHSNVGDRLRIIVASEAGRCVGILPFSRVASAGPENNESEWVYGEEAVIAREYFCYPEHIGLITPMLEPHSCTDLSCFYRPKNLEGFVQRPGCIVDLKETESDYLKSISPKRRSDYLKTEQLNVDIEVVVDNAVRENIVGALREQYIDYWMTKVERRAKGEAEDSRLKILRDFVLFARAEKLGKLVVLYFYLGSRLIAVNFAVRREHDRIDDYLCLRDTERSISKRRIGIFAIIKNMQHSRDLGIRYYDLSDFQAAYKNDFINTSYHYLTPTPKMPTSGLLGKDFQAASVGCRIPK